MSAGICTNCGATLEPNAAFCIVCGTPVSAAPTGGMPMAGAPAGRANHTVVVSGGPGPAPMGATPAGSAAMGATPAGSAAAMGPGAVTGACPSCGAPLEPDAAFCVVCGKPVSAAAPGPSPTPGVAPAPQGGSSGGTVHVSSGPQPATPPAATPPAATPPATPAAAQPAPAASAGPSHKPGMQTVPADELDMLTQLVFLSREEAQNGCTKVIEVDGQKFQVTIPAGTNAGSKLDFPGYGYENARTGKRGILRLNFYVD